MSLNNKLGIDDILDLQSNSCVCVPWHDAQSCPALTVAVPLVPPLSTAGAVLPLLLLLVISAGLGLLLQLQGHIH